MTWARVDDRFPDHTKIDRLLEHGDDGFAAIGVWTLVLARVAGQLSDGWISGTQLARVAPGAERHVKLLVETGLLDLSQDGYLLHDYLDWNDSRDVVLSKAAARRARQAKWRASHNGSRNGSSDASRDASGDAPHPIPSHSLNIQGDASRDASTRILPEWPERLAETALTWAMHDAPHADDDELRARCEQRFGHMLPNAQDPSE